ncbi:MAG: YceI family protein [Deltaproteobacteria bacterium]|nr:YceI family protein [Deltaproteobacteria bacterium]
MQTQTTSLKDQWQRIAILTASLAALAALNGSRGHTADFEVDPGHSRVGFKVRHLVSKTSGEFRDFGGRLVFDDKKPDGGKVDFTIKAASINTNEPKRDEHLKSPDFFDVKKFPTLSFTSKKLVPGSEGKYKLEGDLTIHGVTKPVTFDVDYHGVQKDPWGGTRAGFTATTKVNRRDYGLTWNKALETGGLLVGEDVEIELEIEALQKKI